MPSRRLRENSPTSFQSAPGLEAGRCAAAALVKDMLGGCFNPRPALRPGDARPSQARLIWFGGFNPRPALRPGDAKLREDKRKAEVVSIRARP